MYVQYRFLYLILYWPGTNLLCENEGFFQGYALFVACTSCTFKPTHLYIYYVMTGQPLSSLQAVEKNQVTQHWQLLWMWRQQVNF